MGDLFMVENYIIRRLERAARERNWTNEYEAVLLLISAERRRIRHQRNMRAFKKARANRGR